ncbi:hypothetical protein [Propionicicella superfundia]|uniref:hypothetical protein n=1 Tax=Propionicicella superfundia TaxID=348582 RepID=UPI0012EC763B|nr:hypothetical protein [Propionicicella superfundia]
MLRNLPTSRIEAAINRSQFAVTGATRFEGGTMTMPSGRILRSEDVMKPLGGPKRTPDFYEVGALQHTRLVDDGDRTPPREWRESAAYPSRPRKAGSPAFAAKACSRPDGVGAPDSRWRRPRLASRPVSEVAG